MFCGIVFVFAKQVHRLKLILYWGGRGLEKFAVTYYRPPDWNDVVGL